MSDIGYTEKDFENYIVNLLTSGSRYIHGNNDEYNPQKSVLPKTFIDFVKAKNKVQLINANSLFEKRRKALGNKRNDISKDNIKQIVELYSNYEENELSKFFDTKDFGYTTITVERPLKDEKGELILKAGKKQADSSLRDTENVPLKENIEEYFKREVLPFAPDAWVDERKNVVGYEIPFTRYFYKYEAPRLSSRIMDEIKKLEKNLAGSLTEIFWGVKDER